MREALLAGDDVVVRVAGDDAACACGLRLLPRSSKARANDARRELPLCAITLALARVAECALGAALDESWQDGLGFASHRGFVRKR